VLDAIKSLIEKHFIFCIVGAAGLGLFAPGVEKIPSEVVIGFLAFIVFLSAFNVDLKQLRGVSLTRCFVYFFIRFIVFPVVIFYVVSFFYLPFALSCLLLALMPVGTSVPAFSSLFRGNVSLALSLLVISTLATPFTVPLLTKLLVSEAVEIDKWALFRTLCVTVFVPLAIWFPLRNQPLLTVRAREYGPSVSILLICTIIGVVFAQQRDVIFGQGDRLIGPVVVGALMYGSFYLFGWCFPCQDRSDRISCTTASGINNLALGITLSLLYFPAHVSVFMILCEISWLGAIVLSKYLFLRSV